MSFIVTFNNPGGELDRRVAADGSAAAKALIEMIEEAGELYDGDTIEIKEAA